MIKSEPVDRFYLYKGAKTIFIDSANIPQNYLEGIRFLYRSFNKKKPGIILNDESNISRNTQIVLFLKAVQLLINKTILIVCPEDAEQTWMSLFDRWTEFNEDVVIETEKSYIRKKVIINPSQALQNFCSREWGMIIVDDDQTMLDILRYPFKADFKIWSSPTKMTEHLKIFSQIYKWLYPKSIFHEKDFVSNERNPCNAVAKAILLDAFLEDVVLRKRGGTDEEQAKAPDKPKVTRKNKDATGTKIKRSKPKPCEDIPIVKVSEPFEEVNASNSKLESTITSIVKENDGQNVSNEAVGDEIDDNECTIMNFKKKRDIVEDSEDNKPENNLETQTELNLYYENTENSDKIYEMDTLPLDNEDFNDESRNNEVSGVKLIIHDEIGPENEISNENIDRKINEIKTNTKESNEIEKKYENKLNITLSDSEVTNDILKNEVLKIKDDSNGHSPFVKMQTDKDIESNVDRHFSDENKLMKEIEEKDNELTNEISNNQDLNKKDTGNSYASVKMPIEKAIESYPGISDVNKSGEKSVPANTLKRGVEDKMREIEERALKKFKGSILDSLF